MQCFTPNHTQVWIRGYLSGGEWKLLFEQNFADGRIREWQKKEVSRALSIFLSLSVRTKESNLFPYFKLELSCHPLLDLIKVI